jgi:hypothetical protein
VVYIVFARDDDVVDVGEYILANLVFKYGLSEAGECGPNILVPFVHPHETIGAEGCDETGIHLVLFAEIYLVVARETIKQGHDLIACCRIDDFVDAREGGLVLRACFV